jgi:hypothetical protein
MASKMVVIACPSESFWTTPKSGTGAMGMIRTMPYRIRSHNVKTRLKCGVASIELFDVFTSGWLRRPPAYPDVDFKGGLAGRA